MLAPAAASASMRSRPVGIGAAERAVHMRVERHRLPTDVRAAAASPARRRDTVRSAASCSRSSVPPTVACSGPAASAMRVATASRGPSRLASSADRAQVGQPGQAGDQAMRRLARRAAWPAAVCARRCRVDRVAARAVELADVERPAERVGEVELARTVQRNGDRGAGQRRADIQPRDPQLVQHDRHGQRRAAAGGRRGRHPHRRRRAPPSSRSIAMRRCSSCNGDQSSTTSSTVA